MKMNRGFAPIMWVLVAILLVSTAFAQETTAGLQGTVRDPQGLAVSKATVEISGPALIGTKKLETDSSGYYRFANLPVGEYTITISAPNFKTSKLTGVKLSAGSLPTIDPKLEVGAIEQTVEVSGEAPIVDVTQSKVQVTVSKEELDSIPKGRSFQSVIPFAPGARQEPLQTRREESGRNNGFQIDGASDSENVYMVEGMNTTNIQDGGVGRANVPFEFVQEVQIKSSSFEAEFGGALGGVVNVIQKRGGPKWHGSLFTYWQGDALNANDQCITNGFINTTCGLRLRPGTAFSPAGAGPNRTSTTTGLPQPGNDGVAEYYKAKEDRWRTLEPGFELGGALLKDRIWLFTSYVPNYTVTTRQVNFTGANPGLRSFTRRDTTHNALSRIDYRAFNNLRLFGSWQYGYAVTTGINMPGTNDSLIPGQVNTAAGTDPNTLRTDTGTVRPMNIMTFGGDWTVTPKMVVTARYGYQYQDTQDRGRPTGTRYLWQTDSRTTPAGIPVAAKQNNGFANIPSNLQTLYDVYSRRSFNSDVSYFTNFFGTHNLKAGYTVQRLANNVNQNFFTSLVLINYGSTYDPGTASGIANCATIVASGNNNGGCGGVYGYYNVSEGVITNGNVSSLSHGLYFQDAWSFKGFTVNGGVRIEKEHVPEYQPGAGSLDFGFGSKVAPRIGVAYDVLHNGKVKAYFSYGKFFDIMKLGLPRGSFGGDYWHDCAFAMDDPDFSHIVPAVVGAHYCPADGSAPSGSVPGRFIENINLRQNPNGPGLPALDVNMKPVQQHEYVAGVDWAITPMIGLEARYSRKRLDETIEDIGITDDLGFYISNPGSAFAQLLHRNTWNAVTGTVVPPACPTCPLQPKAIRDYDGLEFRLTKRASDKWFGSLSYTYSKLNGNYPGLSSTFIADGNGGRHSPNNNRSFDHPQMQFDSHGKLIDGPLPTDRPHTLKMFGFYRLKWLGQETLLGATEQVFTGTPQTTCWATVGTASSCQFVEGMGGWVNLSRAANGDFVVNSIEHNKRSPLFSQMDLNFQHEVKVSKTNEAMRLGFTANVSNLFNQHAPLVLNNAPLASGTTTPVDPLNPTGFDEHAMLTGWNYIATANSVNNSAANYQVLASRYGLPVLYQGARSIRLQLKFTF
jgi:hypothetical protein